MGKYFRYRDCDLCGKHVSTAGFAWASHMRRHVREGLATEQAIIVGGSVPACEFRYTQIGQARIVERMNAGWPDQGWVDP
jgi:hypothetical protein